MTESVIAILSDPIDDRGCLYASAKVGHRFDSLMQRNREGSAQMFPLQHIPGLEIFEILYFDQTEVLQAKIEYTS